MCGERSQKVNTLEIREVIESFDLMRLDHVFRSNKMGCATTSVKIASIVLNAVLGVSHPIHGLLITSTTSDIFCIYNHVPCKEISMMSCGMGAQVNALQKRPKWIIFEYSLPYKLEKHTVGKMFLKIFEYSAFAGCVFLSDVRRSSSSRPPEIDDLAPRWLLAPLAAPIYPTPSASRLVTRCHDSHVYIAPCSPSPHCRQSLQLLSPPLPQDDVMSTYPRPVFAL